MGQELGGLARPSGRAYYGLPPPSQRAAAPQVRIHHQAASGDAMATSLSFVEYVVEQARLGDELTHRKMFGEYALYLGGKVVALACDNSVFVKPMARTRTLCASLPRRVPYPGAKPYVVADALLDEPEQLRALLLATEQALPAPKPRRAKRKS
jgi:TfoX/Sxy family transcriptional regulator of competence genes